MHTIRKTYSVYRLMDSELVRMLCQRSCHLCTGRLCDSYRTGNTSQHYVGNAPATCVRADSVTVTGQGTHHNIMLATLLLLVYGQTLWQLQDREHITILCWQRSCHLCTVILCDSYRTGNTSQHYGGNDPTTIVCRLAIFTHGNETWLMQFLHMAIQHG